MTFYHILHCYKLTTTININPSTNVTKPLTSPHLLIIVRLLVLGQTNSVVISWRQHLINSNLSPVLLSPLHTVPVLL